VSPETIWLDNQGDLPAIVPAVFVAQAVTRAGRPTRLVAIGELAPEWVTAARRHLALEVVPADGLDTVLRERRDRQLLLFAGTPIAPHLRARLHPSTILRVAGRVAPRTSAEGARLLDLRIDRRMLGASRATSELDLSRAPEPLQASLDRVARGIAGAQAGIPGLGPIGSEIRVRVK
jgi:hypothetical protein